MRKFLLFVPFLLLVWPATRAPAVDGAAAAAVPAVGPARGKASIAVIPFETTPEVARADAGDLDLLYDALVRVLVRSNKFDVLERTKIDAAIDENRFAASSLGDPANAARLGRLAGAQYLLVGTIRSFGVRTFREPIPYTSEYKCTESAHLRLEVRVVQATSGRIVAAESAGDSSGPPAREVSCGRARGTVLDDAMARTAVGLVDAIIDRIYPITVVHVAGEVLTINRGRGGTVAVGSRLDCFTKGEDIVDPATGDVLGSAESPAGRIAVTEVADRMSKARADIAGTVPSGAVCRMAPPEPRAPAKATPRPKVDW